MPLTPGESDRLLLFLAASLAQRRRDRGLLLNVPEARSLIADAVCEWARDGLSLPETLERARALLTPDDVLPGVPEALSEVRVEARFDDGTRLVVVKEPFGTGSAAVSEPASTPADQPRWRVIEITNEAPTPIGLTSHIHLAEVNPRLRLDRAGAFGNRLALETGQTVWIRPGESVSLPMRPIEGDRVMVGNSGAVDGSLDDEAVRSRALAVLRSCGYLDIVEGDAVNTAEDAAGAIAALMRQRGEES
ncbi:MAG: urease subunit gamma [Actinomycetales bacterium]|nr:urease subunit gamma [Actinomycetales bacterium]